MSQLKEAIETIRAEWDIDAIIEAFEYDGYIVDEIEAIG